MNEQWVRPLHQDRQLPGGLDSSFHDAILPSLIASFSHAFPTPLPPLPRFQTPLRLNLIPSSYFFHPHPPPLHYPPIPPPLQSNYFNLPFTLKTTSLEVSFHSLSYSHDNLTSTIFTSLFFIFLILYYLYYTIYSILFYTTAFALLPNPFTIKPHSFVLFLSFLFPGPSPPCLTDSILPQCLPLSPSL